MSQYARGANFERLVKKDLEDHGYLAFRVAGSKGVADIIAFPPAPGPAWLVQAKTNGKMSRAEVSALHQKAHKYRLVPIKASRPKRGKILYQRHHAYGDAGYQWSEVLP